MRQISVGELIGVSLGLVICLGFASLFFRPQAAFRWWCEKPSKLFGLRITIENEPRFKKICYVYGAVFLLLGFALVIMWMLDI